MYLEINGIPACNVGLAGRAMSAGWFKNVEQTLELFAVAGTCSYATQTEAEAARDYLLAHKEPLKIQEVVIVDGDCPEYARSIADSLNDCLEEKEG